MARQDVRGELVRIAMPVIGLNMLGVLSLGIDTAMCGHLSNGDVALAALGFATQVVLASNVTVLGLTVGTVALIARAHGARDPHRVAHVLTQSLVVTLLVALVVGTGLNLVASPLLTVLGARGDVHALALDYLRPMLGLAVFHFVATLLAGAMRGVGVTRPPFVIALGCTVLHVALAAVFIHGGYGVPPLGVRGAALSAIVSQLVAVVLLFAYVRDGHIDGLSLARGAFALDRGLVARLAALGLPAALDMLIIHGSFLVIVAMLAPFGDASVASNSVGLRVQSLAFVPGLAISQATAALVGAALGARDVGRARSVARASLAFTTVTMLVLCACITFASPFLLGLFGVLAGSPIASLATTWMRLLGLSLPIAGANIALVGVLRGAGATTTSLFVNVVGTLCVQIPLAYAFGHVFGLGAIGVWIAVPIAFVARLAMSTWFYRRGAWARVGEG